MKYGKNDFQFITESIELKKCEIRTQVQHRRLTG